MDASGSYVDRVFPSSHRKAEPSGGKICMPTCLVNQISMDAQTVLVWCWFSVVDGGL